MEGQHLEKQKNQTASKIKTIMPGQILHYWIMTTKAAHRLPLWCPFSKKINNFKIPPVNGYLLTLPEARHKI